MKRNKCKECKEWKKDEGVCDLNYNVHSPGKKRDCINFKQRKTLESTIPVFRMPWMSRWDKRKLRLRAELDKKKQQEIQNLLDQQKLLQEVEPPSEVAVEAPKGIQGIKGIKGVPIVKKPTFFKKLFRQKII